MSRAFHSLVALFAFAVAALVVAASSPAVLVNHWDFDEPNGQAAPQLTDQVGGNNATFNVNMSDSNRSTDVPTPVWFGRSLGFNGSDETATTASQIVLDDTDSYSISLWYRGTDSATNGDWGHALLGRDNNDIFANLVLRSGRVEFVHFNGGWQHNIQSTSLVNDDQWHHIVYVNNAAQTGSLYIDGVQEINNLSSTIGGGLFRIDGFMKGFNVQWTSGLLDDVQIYNHSLTSAEVLDLFEGFQVPEPSTFALLGLGVVGVVGSRRRNLHRAAK